MKLAQAIQSLGAQQSLAVAQELAEAQQLNWQASISSIFAVIVADLNRVPNNLAGNTEVQAIDKWLKRLSAWV